MARGLRGFVDGLVSVSLGSYLAHIGYDAVAVGAVVTATLFGSGVMTLAVGLFAHRHSLRRLLMLAAVSMAATGAAFASVESFVVLLLLAFVGTLNPSSGDVSVFLPLEQALLANAATTPAGRTASFARYNVVGAFAAALGALCAGLPAWVAGWRELPLVEAERGVFVVYAAVGVSLAALYAGMSELRAEQRASRPLSRSRDTVLRLAALFSLDSFAGGFVVQSLLALWLLRRYELSLEAAGMFFFASSLAGALSQFGSPRLAARIGLIRTMVYTHIPANLFLIAAAFMPTLGLTMTCLLLRASVSSMDVPARQAYVMAVVPPEERAAAASVTNVPRSLASALSPILTGMMLQQSSFGWPLIWAGTLKIVYDLLLLAQFRSSDPHAA
jgi:MFS family permease